MGVVRLDNRLNSIWEFGSIVRPCHDASVIEAAMNVHGITLDELASAPTPQEVVSQLSQLLSSVEGPVVLSGWNVWFDVSFLREMYRRVGQAWPFGHRMIDVQSIAAFFSGLCPASQSETIQLLLNENQSHRALGDARHTARLLRHFYAML
jgi:DNA polymerase III epsilon subunit-like protein